MSVRFEPRWYPIVAHRAVDGDTVELTLDIGFRVTFRASFRLVGVDTPERGQPGFKEATEFTRTWLDERVGQLSAYVSGQDKYGRWLARIEAAGNYEPSLAGQLLEAGLAVPL